MSPVKVKAVDGLEEGFAGAEEGGRSALMGWWVTFGELTDGSVGYVIGVVGRVGVAGWEGISCGACLSLVLSVKLTRLVVGCAL